MKKILYIIPLALTMACGGNTANNDDQNGKEEGEGNEAAMTGVTHDLTEHGFDYTIVLPEKQDAQVNIAPNNMGGVDIQQGQNLWITMNYGEGALDIVKFDLEEHEFYQAEILEEGESHLLYKLTDKAGTLKPTFHFYYAIPLPDGDAIVLENSKDADFGEEAARKMLMAAQTVASTTEA